MKWEKFQIKVVEKKQLHVKYIFSPENHTIYSVVMKHMAYDDQS
jgi:hypothetical protein